jgi:Domain of unknown function (DUF4263)
MIEDKLEKLRFSTWLDESRESILPLIEVLRDERRCRQSEHLSFLKQRRWEHHEIKYLGIPATSALLIYGAEGLDALYEAATAWPEGTLSDSGFEFYVFFPWRAQKALLAVALGRTDVVHEEVRWANAYLEDRVYEKLLQDIRNTCESLELQREARRQLSRVVHSCINEPSARYRLARMLDIAEHFLPILQLQERHSEWRDYRLEVQARQSEALKFILELVAQGTLNVSDIVCHGLEVLVGDDLPEKEYQEYFERHPALIDPLASSIVERQHMGEEWRSDFVIRRLDDQYIFVEIEKPQDNPFTNYPHPSAALSHALGQVLNWFVWVEDNVAYAQSHGFPGIHSPKGVVVIGRSGDLNSAQLRLLKGLNDLLHPRIRIETYDDVLLNARNIIRNLTAK